MVSWFAGLFYLPRIFVNLAMTQTENKVEAYEHLLLMAKKLYRFVTPFMMLTIFFGSWMLYLNDVLINSLWMQIKLGFVLTLVMYHFICGYDLKRFINKDEIKGHIYYRWFNEFPVIVLFSVIILAIIKP
ncbi:MAG: putative membrane protein [Polaribacter sp.]|jgi:putative membrane protein